MRFAERLKELRNENQCTQKKLATFLRLTPNTICEWEKNRSEPSLTTLIKIASFFEVSVDYLIGNSDDFGVMIAAPMGDGLTLEERELLQLYRELSPYLQGMTMEAVRSWAKKGGDSSQKKA